MKISMHLIFPGGGVFCWWCFGVIKSLKHLGYDLQHKDITMSGASAGSIACVLAACDVDMDVAMKLALQLADEAGVFTRKHG